MSLGIVRTLPERTGTGQNILRHCEVAMRFISVQQN